MKKHTIHIKIGINAYCFHLDLKDKVKDADNLFICHFNVVFLKKPEKIIVCFPRKNKLRDALGVISPTQTLMTLFCRCRFLQFTKRLEVEYFFLIVAGMGFYVDEQL